MDPGERITTASGSCCIQQSLFADLARASIPENLAYRISHIASRKLGVREGIKEGRGVAAITLSSTSVFFTNLVCCPIIFFFFTDRWVCFTP